MKERIPTCWQAQTLKTFMEGGELIIGQSQVGKERIFWKVKAPHLHDGFDTVECCYPKLKRYRMSHMERYRWVKKTKNGWKITKDGEKAYERYKSLV